MGMIMFHVRPSTVSVLLRFGVDPCASVVSKKTCTVESEGRRVKNKKKHCYGGDVSSSCQK